MNDESGAVPEEPTVEPPKDAQPGDAWDDLGRQLNELGSAIARAVRAGIDDPENRRRAAELRDGLDSIAREVGAAFDEAAASPHGQRVKEEVGKAAESVAAAGRRVADDVRPHLIEAARSASERLKEAAAGMEQRAQAARAGEPVPESTDDTGETEPRQG
jgi:hypothetical protein